MFWSATDRASRWNYRSSESDWKRPSYEEITKCKSRTCTLGLVGRSPPRSAPPTAAVSASPKSSRNLTAFAAVCSGAFLRARFAIVARGRRVGGGRERSPHRGCVARVGRRRRRDTGRALGGAHQRHGMVLLEPVEARILFQHLRTRTRARNYWSSFFFRRCVFTFKTTRQTADRDAATVRPSTRLSPSACARAHALQDAASLRDVLRQRIHRVNPGYSLFRVDPRESANARQRKIESRQHTQAALALALSLSRSLSLSLSSRFTTSRKRSDSAVLASAA